MQHRRNSGGLTGTGKAFWVWLLFAWVLQGVAADTEVSIGDVRIRMPNPRGFVAITEEMTNAIQFLDSRVSPRNTRLASFVPEPSAAAPASGPVARASKVLSAQSLKGLDEKSFTDAEFAGIKDALRQQNAAAVARVEARFPGAAAALSNDVAAALLNNPALRSLGTIPLPIHQETPSHIAFSAIVNSSARGAGSPPGQDAGVFTAILLRVKGKILYLYAYGKETDLLWTRTASQDWVAQVIDANTDESNPPAKVP